MCRALCFSMTASLSHFPHLPLFFGTRPLRLAAPYFCAVDPLQQSTMSLRKSESTITNAPEGATNFAPARTSMAESTCDALEEIDFFKRLDDAHANTPSSCWEFLLPGALPPVTTAASLHNNIDSTAMEGYPRLSHRQSAIAPSRAGHHHRLGYTQPAIAPTPGQLNGTEPLFQMSLQGHLVFLHRGGQSRPHNPSCDTSRPAVCPDSRVATAPLLPSAMAPAVPSSLASKPLPTSGYPIGIEHPDSRLAGTPTAPSTVPPAPPAFLPSSLLPTSEYPFGIDPIPEVYPWLEDPLSTLPPEYRFDAGVGSEHQVMYQQPPRPSGFASAYSAAGIKGTSASDTDHPSTRWTRPVPQLVLMRRPGAADPRPEEWDPSRPWGE